MGISVGIAVGVVDGTGDDSMVAVSGAGVAGGGSVGPATMGDVGEGVKVVGDKEVPIVCVGNDRVAISGCDVGAEQANNSSASPIPVRVV